MKLPPIIAIGSYLVLQVDHADRLVGVAQAPSLRRARRMAQQAPPDVAAVAIIRVVNQAQGRGQQARNAGPVSVPLDRLAPDAGVVISAAADGSVVSVRPAPDVAAAYEAEHSAVAPSIPHVVVGQVNTSSTSTQSTTRRRR